MIEQLSKENPNPSHLSPQYIKNLAKTIEQNRTTGQYLSTNANTGANASVNLLHRQQTQVTQKKYQKPKGSKKCNQSNQQQQLSQPHKKSHPLWKDNKGNQNPKSNNDCTQCGDFRHKDKSRCPTSRHKCKICSRTGHFPRIKSSSMYSYSRHMMTRQPCRCPMIHSMMPMEYMPSDDDFVHNYMICMYKTSLQSKKCKNTQFQ